METLKPLLTVEDVARIVGLPVSTIYQQRHRRVGVGVLGFRTGKHLRWNSRSLEQSEKAREEALG